MLGYTSLISVVHFIAMNYLLFTVLFLTFFILCSHISIVIYTHDYMHEHLFPLFTHSLGPDDPRFAHLDIECFISLIRCSLKL